MVTQTVTLNGTTSFSAFGESYSWSGQRIEAAFFDNSGSATADTLRMTLEGADWAVRRFEIEGSSPATPLDWELIDSNDGQFRRIDRVQIGDFSDITIILKSARIRHIEGGNGNASITLGSEDISTIDLWTGINTIILGSGSAKHIDLGDGTNTVTQGSGWLGTLEMGEGTNIFNGGTGSFGTIRAWGDNDLTFHNGGDVVLMGEGTNKLTLTADSIGTVNAGGNNTIALQNDARILSLKMDRGTNLLTTEEGNIESLYAYAAKNTFLLGEGGAQQIVISGSAAAQVIKSEGWIGSLQVYAGNQTNVQATTVVTGDQGAGYIQTSKGNDSITTGAGRVFNIYSFDGNDKITIGPGEADNVHSGIGNDTVIGSAGRVDALYTEEGNDRVVLGALGARFVSLGDGNDTILLSRFTPEWGVQIQGDGGSDTVDMSGFATALHVTLANWGQYQNVGSPTGGGAAAFGYVGLVDIENLIGTGAGDWIEGSFAANALTGGAGGDVLLGLEGNDRLIGGLGNDSLTGGADKDVFVFKGAEGTDHITDFTLGEDRIELRAASGLASLSFTKVGEDVRIDFGAGLHIIVEDHTIAEMKAAANFLF